jgi:hypothetical protein
MQFSARILALSAFLCLLVAAPAFAGQIVYSSNDSIVVANDDGSDVRTLVTPADVPGATKLYNPHVDPNGTKVVFTARTPFTEGIFCGFNCAAVYTWDAGRIERVSGEAIGCAGDPCLGLNVDPKIAADGQSVFYQRIYGEPGGTYGTPQTISMSYVAPAVANGSSQESELTKEAVGAECTRPNGFVPNPANVNEYTFVDCWPLDAPEPAPSSALKLRRADGSSEIIGGDDYYEIVGMAWRPDGGELVTVESGEDKGIWLYQPVGYQQQTPRHILAIGEFGDTHQSSVNPAFVGNDRIAYHWNGEIRSIPTSCDRCAPEQGQLLVAAPEADGVAWTSRALPRPQQGGGGDGGDGGPMAGGGGFQASAPSGKLKIAKALKGIVIRYRTDGPGRIAMKATVNARTAKKLKLGRKALTVASGKAAPTGAGESSFKLKFTKKAIKRLKKAKSLKLKLSGTWTPAGGSAHGLSGSLSLKR